MAERTGYWVGEATGESQDDNPDGYCAASYELCRVIKDGRPLDVDCDRMPNHPGDHWDRTFGIFWRGKPATRKEWEKVRER
jgi:hypothetical protein